MRAASTTSGLMPVSPVRYSTMQNGVCGHSAAKMMPKVTVCGSPSTGMP